MPPYRDRPEAGRQLVPLLRALPIAETPALVVAIPNGGVPVALPVARALEKPLHVLVARKAQYPWTTEAGFGAVTADGVTVYNEAALSRRQMPPETVEAQVTKARAEVHAREARFADFLLPADLTRHPVILVDDGLASGITTRAAIESLRQRGTPRVVVAVPTAHQHSVDDLLERFAGTPGFEVRVVCPDRQTGWSFAVAAAYADWHDETTAGVLQLLANYQEDA